MASRRQLEANRRNAQKSTGPKSEKGKSVTRFNALRHGLTSEEVLLPEEDKEAFNELHEGLEADLSPEGALENRLVDHIAVNLWRLKRVQKVEAGIFIWGSYEAERNRAEEESKQIALSADEILGPRAASAPSRHRSAAARVKELEELQTGALPALGLTFVQDSQGANAFSKLSRYETAMERSLYRALHELQRLQSARRGGDSIPPLAVDVTIDGDPASSRDEC